MVITKVVKPPGEISSCSTEAVAVGGAADSDERERANPTTAKRQTPRKERGREADHADGCP
jgi:hypothetical protein